MDEQTNYPDPLDGAQAETNELSRANGAGNSGTAQLENDSAPVTRDATEDRTNQIPLPFYVVGLGASAGGVEAYIELFGHLPSDTGMAYVVVLHLSGDQESHLPEILARHTQMPVKEIADRMGVEPDHVYVVPPGALLGLEGGVFRLGPMERPQRAIDHFFYSLTASQKHRAIGIILSGMDSDGAQGMRAIKGDGGITMVQAPESARFPDMPRSTISIDHVDIISTPRAIATQLTQLGRQFRPKSFRLLEEGAPPIEGEEQYFNRILAMMRSVSGVDFRLYKPSTIRRRIARRMLLHRIDNLSDYASFLQANTSEVRDLQQDALINVTRFFRDPEVFETFKNFVLPRLLEAREPAQQVRIWVAGCSSGEEVYSFAICLLEAVSGSAVEPPIQIFGTDASEANIQKARTGTYGDTITSDVSPERLRRFFGKVEKGYQVAKRVRDLCIFARQTLCHDPPFSRMDVISCRNVLIYFGAELQRQLIPTFHYALRPNGFLILGTSETIREFSELFVLADRKNKIYSRTAAVSSRGTSESLTGGLMPELASTNAPQTPDVWGDMEVQRAADRILLTRYAPPAVVINERMQILQARGRLTPFLEIRPGIATLDLFRLTRESVAAEVNSAVRRAIEQDLPVRVEGLHLSEEEVTEEAALEVVPIHNVGHQSKCYLVVFAPWQSKLARNGAPAEASELDPEDRDRLIAQLRHDLSSTKLYLQSLLEDRDAKNQELLSANEEIQSANEELQSTNEELETTKEELQSSNEELHTLNDELQNRNTVLTQTSDDLLNLLNGVNLPVLMLSNELTIRHFTPPTQRVMNLRTSDVGRPVSELRINLKLQDLTPIFSEVLETLNGKEIEVQDTEGRWHLLRVRPYRTADNKIDGLVVALFDIDQLRRGEQELRGARDFARSIIEGVPLPLTVVDAELKIRATNQAFCALARLESGDLDRRFLPSLAGSLWGFGDRLRENLERLQKSGKAAGTFEFEYKTAGESARVFCARGCVLQPDGEQFLLVTIEDLTPHKQAQQLLTKEKERLAREVELKAQALGRTQNELRALAVSLFTSQEEERRRIARELHDDISQRLAALEIEGDQVQRELSAGSDAAKQGMEHMRKEVAKLAEDVRLISHRLHPSMIEDLGLKSALRTLTDEFGRRENMIATFSSENVPDAIPLEVATALYRITQEALRNVGKHAGKTHTRVSLRGMAEGLQMQVADLGHGFDMEGARQGLGLVSMEERARHIGAILHVQSALGEGTKVSVTVPPEALVQRTESAS